jgi:hypothetical protein
MIWNREQYEERQYPTPGRYLRGHKAAFEAAGFPVNVLNPEPGMYILVVSLPASMPQELDPYQLPRRRRRNWHIDGRQVLAWLCVLVIVGGLGYMGYTMATGGALPTWESIAEQMPQLPAMPWAEPAAPHGEPVVEKTGWHWPWESSVVSKPQPQAKQSDGFRWPWQDAQDAAGEAVESIKMAGVMVIGLFAVLATLWIVGIVRGAIGK